MKLKLNLEVTEKFVKFLRYCGVDVPPGAEDVDVELNGSVGYTGPELTPPVPAPTEQTPVEQD